VPIVIISVASGAGEQVLAGLDAGAVDFLQKPTALASDRLLDVADELIEKVKAAAAAPVARVLGRQAEPRIPARALNAHLASAAVDIIVLGISTGGPQALKVVIPQLPADLPVPVAIVLHMPVGYMEMYAQKLNELTTLTVRQASEGDPLEAGVVYMAPAGRHLTFRREGARVVCHLDLRPLDTPHRPSVDVLFHSAAEVFGSRTLGVVMTGMGSDGRDGAAWIKARGGRVITEAEESCVVYGMPRSVVEAGLSDESVPLERIGEAILEHL
jgi:two-component system chemotaxis response regulator CheB